MQHSTPLMSAVMASDLEQTQQLLVSGANPNAANKLGQTPLFIAVSEGRLDIVAKLLEYGANSQQQTVYGNTPLFIAAVECHYRILLHLIEHEHKQQIKPRPYHAVIQKIDTQIKALIHPAAHDVTISEESKHEKIELLVLLREMLIDYHRSQLHIRGQLESLEKKYGEKIFYDKGESTQLIKKVIDYLYGGKTVAIKRTIEMPH